MQALLAFMSFLRSSSLGGNLMQTWRTILDGDGNLFVQKSDVARACAQVGWRGDVAALWSALDAPNGRAALEEFGFKEARALALFRGWAMAHGGIKEMWQRLLNLERAYLRKKGTPKMPDSLDRHGFVHACNKLQSSQGTQPGQLFDANYLFSILDWEPNLKISYKDFRFLENWEPVAWLLEHAEEREARSFKKAVLGKYGNHPVKAWRLCLDLDSTGLCRWTAFNQAAERIQWRGNCAKAWLGLDKQSLGFITLRNIDAEASNFQLLSSKGSLAQSESTL